MTVALVAEAVGRTLGSVIGKSRHLSDLGFCTYQKIFYTGVMPVLDNGPWGRNLVFIVVQIALNILTKSYPLFLWFKKN